MSTIINNARIISPFRVFNGSVRIAEGKISAVTMGDAREIRTEDTVIDARGLYLSPGFVEMLIHGGGNCDVMDGSADAVCHVCRTHMEYGITAIVPSTMCSTEAELVSTCRDIAEAGKIKDRMPEIIGVHLEGPFISPRQGGAQDSKYIIDLAREAYERIYSKCPNIKVWTVAPEIPGALEMGRWMRERGIVASIGHSDADYEDVALAVEHGYTMTTHLFNGMSRLQRIDSLIHLGVAESSLCFDSLTCEVIADGKHVPPNLLKLIYKIKGPMGICLVTDAMRAAGTNATESMLGSLATGQRVEIDDGVAYMPGRQSFGGSVATADRLIRTMHKLADVPIHDAVAMMTIVPARMLGVDDRLGSVIAGKDADILLFDDDIQMKLVMNKGNIFVNRL